MDGKEDGSVLWIERRQRCDGGEHSPTLRGVEVCGETECGGRDGAGCVGLKGSRETPVPVPPKEPDGMASDSQAYRPSHVCPDGGAITVYESGAKRSDIGDCRYDLIPGLHAVALAMGQGAKKFGENNWKGLDSAVCINHALRHIFLWLSGDRSEHHMSHAACNLLMLVELEEKNDG